MKKAFFTIVSSIFITCMGIVLAFLFFWFLSSGPQEIKMNKLKSGWYVEILNEYINIRESADPKSTKIGQVNKGSIYEVLEMNFDNEEFYFYKIKIDETRTGWIANERENRSYLNDVNNPNDIASPSIKFSTDIYFVDTIANINYDHLEVWDDKAGYIVTHEVYHEVVPEENKDQYWIKYTVTDAAGKSDSKTQKIVFTIIPKESEVLDFELFER